MINEAIAMFVLLNPFAMFLYLQPIRRELDHKSYVKVLTKATIISALIYAIFILSKQFLFEHLFYIDFYSFRIFGGVVIFSMAYYFVVRGEKALIKLKGDLDELASEIALPFMVGAGTISLTIIISETNTLAMSFILIFSALLANYAIILLMALIRAQFEKRKLRLAFDKNMEILLRLNGFFLGAIGVDMIIKGILSI